jgi:hypothetical protein
VKGPVKEGVRASQGGSDSQCEREDVRVREGARAREGGAEGKGGSNRSEAAVPGAQARVQARARVSAAEGVNGAAAGGWIAVAAMMCTRPKPVAAALIGTSPEVVSMLAGLRRGDLVEVEGELTLADLGDQGARLAVLVAAARLVNEVVPEVVHEG